MKKTILLAGYDAAVRRMLSRVLVEEDYTVLATSGEEAFERWEESQFDLVLLDLDAPAGDGWEIFQRLNTKYPSVPIVIITAQPNQIFPALASGVGALMEKPLDLFKLLRMIEDLLKEPWAVRIARMEGRPSEFHYVPPKSKTPLYHLPVKF